MYVSTDTENRSQGGFRSNANSILILVSFFPGFNDQRTTRASDSSWNSRSRKAIEQAVGSRDGRNAQCARSRKAQARRRRIGAALRRSTFRSRPGSSRATPQGLGRQIEAYREAHQEFTQ